MHLAVLLWGFTGVLGRAIDMEASMLVWYRMLFTALFVGGILYYRRQWVPVAPKDLGRLTFIGCLMGVHWVAFYMSIKLANASIALVCLSTASVFTTLTHAMFYREKIPLGELSIGLLALFGVLIMYLIPELQQRWFQTTMADDLLPDRNTGIFFGVLAAVISAVFTILNKRIAGKYPVRLMVFYEMGTGWLLVTLLIPFQWLAMPDMKLLPGLADLLWLLILALCCTVWAQSLALNALKYISSFTATLSVNLEPVYGVLLAFIFFRENRELHWSFFAGMAVICLSVVFQMFRLLKPRRQTPFDKQRTAGL